MKEFILQNYDLLISGFLVVISIIVFILRKKPVNDLLGVIYEACLQAVYVVENTSCNKGSEKLAEAVQYVNRELLKKYPDIHVNQYSTFIKSVIEVILASPSKKKGDEKNGK